MQSNGNTLLWALAIIVLLMFVPEFRHWAVSAFNVDGQQTAEASARNAKKEQKAETGTHQTERSGNEDADPVKSRKNDMLWGAYISSIPRVCAAFTIINDGINNGVDFTTYSAQVAVMNKTLSDFKSNTPDPRLFTDADYLSTSSIVNDRIRKAAMACNAANKVWQYKIIRDNSDSLDEYSKQYPYIDEVYNSIAQVYPSIESAIIRPSSPSEGRRYSMEGILAIVMHETSGGINVVLNDLNKLIGNE